MNAEKSLKEQLEILRDEPIQVFTGDPMDIPCIETSDPERLCKNPVVSVDMITYNHEPYIRQAIEGVMMQKTDFEFELVIGEDCSTDRTREICFEYQKRYPDKIRVLWCDHNLYRNPHPAGGNSARNRAHCRGEFIAFCEGDDYWTDPLKLQKQVNVMRKHPNVGFCFTAGQWYLQQTGRFMNWHVDAPFGEGLIAREEFVSQYIGIHEKDEKSSRVYLITASVLLRRSIFEKIIERYDVFSWRMRLGDTTLWLGFASCSDVYFMPDKTSVYRIQQKSVSRTNGCKVSVDACIVRLYWLIKFGLILYESIILQRIWMVRFHYLILERDLKNAVQVARGLCLTEIVGTVPRSRAWVARQIARNVFFAGLLIYPLRFRRLFNSIIQSSHVGEL